MASIYSEDYQRVIKALRAGRLAKGMTHAQLAKALDKPQSFVAKVDAGVSTRTRNAYSASGSASRLQV